MQRRKIVIAALSLLLVGLALPTANVNKAHAFTTGVYSVQIGNVLTGILGFAELALGQSPRDGLLRGYLQELHRASLAGGRAPG